MFWLSLETGFFYVHEIKNVTLRSPRYLILMLVNAHFLCRTNFLMVDTYNYNILVILEYIGGGNRLTIRSKNADWILLKQTALEVD